VVFINNLVVTLLIGPSLVAALQPRVRRWGLLYTDILDERELRTPRFAWAGVALVWVAAIAGFAIGNVISLHLGGQFLGDQGARGAAELARTVAVPVGLLILGSLLL
jgi:energy-coupling factor transport system substrate-specific component